MNGILPLGVLLLGLLVQHVAQWLVMAALPKICLSAVLPSLSWLTGFLMDTCMRLLLLLAELGAGEGMYLQRAMDSWGCTAVVLSSVFLLIFGWRILWLRRCSMALFFCWLTSCVLGLGTRAPRLFVSFGNDGGVPAVCIVHGNREAEILCCGSKEAAAELRRAFMRHGIEDVGYLPVIPQADVAPGAYSLARGGPPRCAGIPAGKQASRELRTIVRLCETSGTYIRRTRQTDAGIWQCGFDGASLEHRACNGAYSMRFRRNQEEVRMDRMASGQCIVTLHFPGVTASRFQPPSSLCGTTVMTLSSRTWLSDLAGLLDI